MSIDFGGAGSRRQASTGNLRFGASFRWDIGSLKQPGAASAPGRDPPFLIEVIATFFFLYVIIGTTSKGAAVGFAGIPIGLCLTLIHLFLIPVTNASVNPARSTGPALFAGGAYISQLWLFWLAPMLGAALAGVVGRWQHELVDIPAK